MSSTPPPAGRIWFGSKGGPALDPPEKSRGWLTAFDAYTGVLEGGPPSSLEIALPNLDEATDDLVRALDECVPPAILVSNEVGLGIVPETPLGRAFRDAQGRLNMRMADRADRVILMSAGLPLLLKDRPAPRKA